MYLYMHIYVGYAEFNSTNALDPKGDSMYRGFLSSSM